MGVVTHGYGELGGVRGGGWYACRTKPGGVDRVCRDAGALPVCEVEALMIVDHTAILLLCSW